MTQIPLNDLHGNTQMSYLSKERQKEGSEQSKFYLCLERISQSLYILCFFFSLAQSRD